MALSPSTHQSSDVRPARVATAVWKLVAFFLSVNAAHKRACLPACHHQRSTVENKIPRPLGLVLNAEDFIYQVRVLGFVVGGVVECAVARQRITRQTD